MKSDPVTVSVWRRRAMRIQNGPPKPHLRVYVCLSACGLFDINNHAVAADDDRGSTGENDSGERNTYYSSWRTPPGSF